MKLKHLLLSSLMLLSAGTAWADIRINTANFPDANFRSFLTSQDYGSDGMLTNTEITKIKNLMLSSMSIQNLNGIKYFTALQYLSCDGNQLTSLDVSECKTLIELDCSNNQLTSLDVSGCSALTSIMCSNNKLKGDAIYNLIECLPTTQGGELYVIDTKSDGNAMTRDQVSGTEAKGWTAYALDRSWYKYAGVNFNINATSVPDKNFREWLLNRSYGKDALLTEEENANVKSINVWGKSIQSLRGIECFIALTELNCTDNQLTSLDVSKNTALTSLKCYNNQLTSLNVSGCTVLTSLDCYSNQLTSLDVSGCTVLTSLYCYSNQLTSLNVSKNTALKTLLCYSNRLTSLDVSKNTALGTLYCYSNQLTSLNVSKNTALKTLLCYSNRLTSLDVSKNTALGTLDCYSNQLTSLDVSKNTELYSLNCKNNQLTSLDVSKNTALIELFCYTNQLTSLDVTKNTELAKLYCYSNQLTWLDVTKNTSLKSLSCGSNQLTSIDVTKNTLLEYLYCDGNQLTSLDVSKNTSLKELYCYTNQLTSLDVSKNIKLFDLYCYDNKLTSLDVSNNTKLIDLYCYQNQIKGAAMDAFVASLRTVSNYTMKIIYHKNEDNVMTPIQVAAAKAKGWEVLYTEDGNNWKEYVGNALYINATYFPDVNFRNWLLNQSYGSDGVLTSAEIAEVTSIEVDSKNIQSLKGIEFFYALTTLKCTDNQLNSLDVSNNTKMIKLYCYDNQLNSLNISKNSKLTFLSCSNNLLTTLDMSVCTELTFLSCYRNQLTSLDVSKNTKLTNIYCDHNQLTSLDVSKNTKLESLHCYSNKLTSLKVMSGNYALLQMEIYQNRIRGDAMDALVNALPSKFGGTIHAVHYENEQNVMTYAQVRALKNMLWTPYYTDGSTDIYGFLKWYEYAGVDPSTGVNNVEASDADDSAPWYTINGTQLTEKPTIPGIYIHNGKKVIIK